MDERKPFSVTELNAAVKQIIESDPRMSYVLVRGELSNYKIYPSGHHYFTLKDSESALRCVMFRGDARGLRFRPENGMNVIALGRIAVYLRDGAYQLYCTGMMPDGVGSLQIAFDKLKAKLDAEGLFDASHKKPLPKYPKSIAVITSSAGAAVHDIIRVAGKRWPGAKIIVMPVRVQGEEAPAEIAGALRYANKYNVAELIITGRGGGSMEDLWAFNDERVARAIYDSTIPVISAVGHEPDVTISDYVADLRAATPSNAAELAVPDSDELRETFDSLGARIAGAVQQKTGRLRSALDDLASRGVMMSPTGFIDRRRLVISNLCGRLSAAEESLLSGDRNRFTELAAKMDALSPLKVLARGYAIAMSGDGAAVKSAAELRQGELLKLMLSDGGAEVSVGRIWRNENGQNG